MSLSLPHLVRSGLAFEVEHHTTILPNGLKHHFASAGSRRNPTILFLHDLADSWRSFERLVPALVERFHILILDQRGHGESQGGPIRHDVADFTDDAIRFIEFVARRPVHVVGHGLGAIVAQRLAAGRPDLVERMVLIGSGVHGDQQALRHLLAEAEALTDPVPEAFVRAVHLGLRHRPLDDGLLGIQIVESLRLSAHAWRATLAGLVQEPPPPPVEAPPSVLIVWGNRDRRYGAGAQVPLRRQFPAAELSVHDRVGNAVHREAPDAVSRAIAAFLAEPD